MRLRGTPLAGGLIPDGRILGGRRAGKLPRPKGSTPSRPSIRRPARRRRGCRLVGGARCRPPASTMLDGPGCIRARLDARLRTPRPSSSGSTRRSACSTAWRANIRRWCARWCRAASTPRGLAEVLRRLVAEGVCLARSARRARGGGARRRIADARPGGAHRAGARGAQTSDHAPPRARSPRRGAAARQRRRGGGTRRHPPTQDGVQLALEPELAEAILHVGGRASAEEPGDRHLRRAAPPRAPARRGRAPALPVIAYHELLPDVEVERVGTIRITE